MLPILTRQTFWIPINVRESQNRDTYILNVVFSQLEGSGSYGGGRRDGAYWAFLTEELWLLTGLYGLDI